MHLQLATVMRRAYGMSLEKGVHTWYDNLMHDSIEQFNQIR